MIPKQNLQIETEIQPEILDKFINCYITAITRLELVWLRWDGRTDGRGQKLSKVVIKEKKKNSLETAANFSSPII